MLTEHQKKLLDNLKAKNRINNKNAIINFKIRNEVKLFFEIELIKLLSQCKTQFNIDGENLKLILLETIKNK